MTFSSIIERVRTGIADWLEAPARFDQELRFLVEKYGLTGRIGIAQDPAIGSIVFTIWPITEEEGGLGPMIPPEFIVEAEILAEIAGANRFTVLCETRAITWAEFAAHTLAPALDGYRSPSLLD